MVRQASKRLLKNGVGFQLIRGDAHYIPFPRETFHNVVATFPAEYIFNLQTLNEIQRVLLPAGQLVIIPTAWITGGRPLERLAAWVFKVSGEAPGNPNFMSSALKSRFATAGFRASSEIIKKRGSQVLVIVAKKSHEVEIPLAQ
jgi:ubiquinone/menaquinone biosynthesis C-methylase UbiE